MAHQHLYLEHIIVEEGCITCLPLTSCDTTIANIVSATGFQWWSFHQLLVLKQ